MKLTRSCDVGKEIKKEYLSKLSEHEFDVIGYTTDLSANGRFKSKGVRLYGRENAPAHLRDTLVCNMNKLHS